MCAEMAQSRLFQNLTAPILDFLELRQHPFNMGGLLTFVLYLWLALFVGCYIWHLAFYSKRRSNLVKDPTECRLLICGKDFRKKDNHLSPFQSRAKHNERLRDVFGIDNSLTTEDPQHSNTFANLMRGLLLLQPAQWEGLSVDLGAGARRWLDSYSPSSSSRIFVPLTPMVQCLTLKFIFLTLFSTYQPACQVDEPELVVLADAIDITWTATKRGCDVPTFMDNKYLREAMSGIFNFNASDEKNNPLSVILPAFEPIWRTVLRIVLELGFHSNPDRLYWKKTLMDFIDKPTRTRFMRSSGTYLVSAEDIVNEALRLYPPTRRIYRSFQQGPEGKITTYGADVEGCHLNTRIWGSDASEFSPIRWKEMTKAQEEAFIPFGTSPFQCPAKPSFGPRAIGLLAGIILREMRNEWSLSEGSDRVKTPEFKERLSNERDAYKSLFLIRYDE